MIRPLLPLLLYFPSFSQDSLREQGSLRVSAYAECYYAYDFTDPASNQRMSFLYNHNRHNEVNLNLGILRAKYQAPAFRGNIALMAGTYPQSNLATEPLLMRNIYEANVGLRLFNTKNTWIDAGILPSHIGFETPIAFDCWTLTRSIVADNSPYYETGVSVNHTTKSQKLYLAVLFLNGWQRIQRLPGAEGPSFGTQLTWTPDQKLKFNWSTYTGNERSVSAPIWRFYNNFYLQYYLFKATGIIAGFDLGLQQRAHKGYKQWYSPVLIIRQALGKNFALAARAEYYNDPDQVIIQTFVPRRFSLQGYSLNFDYLPARNVVARLEGRLLRVNNRAIIGFRDKNNFCLTASLAFSI
jgi:hypothetical protein